MAKKKLARDERRTCFVVTPIGGHGSGVRRSTDGLLDAVIAPTLKKLGFHMEVAHRMDNPGSITRQVIQHIINDDLVVANLTGLNPNVMYEVAIRHCKRKPIVILADDETVLPFDVADERTLFYLDDMKGAVELAPRFEATVLAAVDEELPDNPV